MENAIVVGGAGFIGSAVVRELVHQDVSVTVVVRPGFFEKNINHRLDDLNVRIVECDITKIMEIKTIITDRGFDAYYHFAWDGLFGDSLLDYSCQIMNIKWVMDAIVTASELGCKRFIGSGTIAQYELRSIEGQINQNDKMKFYKTAKIACEYMGRNVAVGHGIQFFWPIITNVYGEGEISPRLINTLIRKLLAGERQALSEGNQIYDFIHISDAAHAFYLIGEKGQEFRTYVIGSGRARPLKDFLCTLRDVINPNIELGFGEFSYNGAYLPMKVFDIGNLVQDTGFEARLPFEEGIKRVVAWNKPPI
jgi:nucleoside-diphosphate-sugar epimerase